MTCAVVAWNDHRHHLAAGSVEADQALVGGTVKAAQFVVGFRFDAQRDQDRAQLQIRYATIEHGAKQFARFLFGHVARPILAAADFLDVVRQIQHMACLIQVW